MDTPLTTTHGILRLLVAAIVALALVMTLGATSATTASPASCRVRNTDTAKTYKALQAAVDAARDGDRLTVRGTCVGGTVIGSRLVIQGISTKRSGKAILDADLRGRALRIKPAARVTMRDLTIQGGSVSGGIPWSYDPEGGGAGILNRGTLRLWDVVVRRNVGGSHGAGIFNAGLLRLRGASRVTRNSALYPVLSRNRPIGGLWNTGSATLSDTSSIRHNSGGGVQNVGRLTLNDATSIEWNYGTGVANGWDNARDASLTMNDTSAITGNASPGVLNYGDLTMNDASSITRHRKHFGYGVANAPGSTFTMSGSSVIRDNDAGVGEYVNSYGGRTLTMSGSSVIRDNDYGLFFRPDDTLVGVVCAPNELANVIGNSSADCTRLP